MSDNELELLRVRIKLLETQLELERVRGGQGTLSMQIREQLDQPDPMVIRNLPPSGTITREMLEALTPAELFILAHKRGIDIKHVFPI